MPHTSRTAALVAVVAFACDPGPGQLDGQDALTFGVTPPDLDQRYEGDLPWERGEKGDRESPNDNTQTRVDPLVESGVWAMRVLETEGPACWSAITPGGGATMTIEADATTLTMMDFVRLRGRGLGEAWGVGSRAAEVADGCLRTDAIFATARIVDGWTMDVHFELAVSYSGTCDDGKAMPEDCSTGWDAHMMRLDDADEAGDSGL